MVLSGTDVLYLHRQGLWPDGAIYKGSSRLFRELLRPAAKKPGHGVLRSRVETL